jgi:hypothetical protein
MKKRNNEICKSIIQTVVNIVHTVFISANYCPKNANSLKISNFQAEFSITKRRMAIESQTLTIISERGILILVSMISQLFARLIST